MSKGCFNRTDGAVPGGAADPNAVNAAGIYYNFAFDSSGVAYSIPFYTTTPVASGGASPSWAQMPIAGTVDFEVRCVTTASGGSCTMTLYQNAVTTGMTVANTQTAGSPGLVYSFTGVSVAQFDRMSFTFTVTTNPGEVVGYVLFNYV